MILLWLILIPLIAGVLAWAAARWSASAARWIALIAVLIDFVLALSLWIGNSRAGLHTWFAQADWAWIPQFGIRFHLAARRPEPLAADAHVLPGHRVRAGVLD